MGRRADSGDAPAASPDRLGAAVDAALGTDAFATIGALDVLAKAGGAGAYAALTKASLKDSSIDVSALTSYAGRRNDEREHLLTALDQQNNAPIIADLSFPGGVILGYVGGAAKWVTAEELGLPPDQPIIVGDASPVEALRHLSDK